MSATTIPYEYENEYLYLTLLYPDSDSIYYLQYSTVPYSSRGLSGDGPEYLFFFSFLGFFGFLVFSFYLFT